MQKDKVQARVEEFVGKVVARLEASNIDKEEIPGIVSECLDVAYVSLDAAADGKIKMPEIAAVVAEVIEARDEIREARAD